MEVVSLIISVSIPLSITYSILHFDFMGMGTSSSSIFYSVPVTAGENEVWAVGRLLASQRSRIKPTSKDVEFRSACPAPMI
jgi:hypothetical protein